MLEPTIGVPSVPRLPVLVPELVSPESRSRERGVLPFRFEERPARWEPEVPDLMLVDPAAHYGWGEAPRRGTLVDVYG